MSKTTASHMFPLPADYNTTEGRIRYEYGRRRRQMIDDLRAIAKTMEAEATMLEGTEFQPQAHWQADVTNLMRLKSEMDGLVVVYPRGEG